jgi:hypothetical protein
MLDKIVEFAGTVGVLFAVLAAFLSLWQAYRTRRIVQEELRQLRTKEGLAPATKSEEEVNSSAQMDNGTEDE